MKLLIFAILALALYSEVTVALLCTPRVVPINGTWRSTRALRTHAVVVSSFSAGSPNEIVSVEYASGNSRLEAVGELVTADEERYVHRAEDGSLSVRIPGKGISGFLPGVSARPSTLPFGPEILGSRMLYPDVVLADGIYSKTLDDQSLAVRISNPSHTNMALFQAGRLPRSSDNSFLCYVYSGALFVTQLDRGGPLRLSDPGTTARLELVLFDALTRRIMFGAFNQTASVQDFYVVNVDGTNRVLIGSFATGVSSVKTWSKGGRWLLLYVQNGPTVTSWALDSLGLLPQVLLVGPSSQTTSLQPVLSPLGEQFIFQQSGDVYFCDMSVGVSSLLVISVVWSDSLALADPGVVYYNNTFSGSDAFYVASPSLVSVQLNVSFPVPSPVTRVPSNPSLFVLRNPLDDTSVLMNVASNQAVDVVSRPGDAPTTFYFQPRVFVSLVYYDASQRIVVSSCLVASQSATGGAIPTSAPGHVFLEGNLSGASAISVFVGSAVIAPNTNLAVPIACKQGVQNVSLVDANWIEGSFANIDPTGCPQECSTQSSTSQTTESITLTVTISCNTGLSRGAIAGIVVGSIVGGTLIALGVVVLLRYKAQVLQRDLKSQMRERELDDLRGRQNRVQLL